MLFYRYIVIDLEWVAADGRKISKICLIGYAPDGGEKWGTVGIPAHLEVFKSGLGKQVADARQMNLFDDLTEEHLRGWFKE